MTAATAGHRRESLIDQDAHVAFISVEVIDKNVTGIRSVLGPSLIIDKVHVGSGSRIKTRYGLSLKGWIG